MKDQILAVLIQHMQQQPTKKFWELAQEFRDEGKTQSQVWDAFIDVYEQINQDGSDYFIRLDNQVKIVSHSIVDAYDDTLDRIWGWCGAQYRLWDTVLGDKNVGS